MFAFRKCSGRKNLLAFILGANLSLMFELHSRAGGSTFTKSRGDGKLNSPLCSFPPSSTKPPLGKSDIFLSQNVTEILLWKLRSGFKYDCGKIKIISQLKNIFGKLEYKTSPTNMYSLLHFRKVPCVWCWSYCLFVLNWCYFVLWSHTFRKTQRKQRPEGPSPYIISINFVFMKKKLFFRKIQNGRQIMFQCDRGYSMIEGPSGATCIAGAYNRSSKDDYDHKRSYHVQEIYRFDI